MKLMFLHLLLSTEKHLLPYLQLIQKQLKTTLVVRNFLKSWKQHLTFMLQKQVVVLVMLVLTFVVLTKETLLLWLTVFLLTTWKTVGFTGQTGLVLVMLPEPYKFSVVLVLQNWLSTQLVVQLTSLQKLPIWIKVVQSQWKLPITVVLKLCFRYQPVNWKPELLLLLLAHVPLVKVILMQLGLMLGHISYL